MNTSDGNLNASISFRVLYKILEKLNVFLKNAMLKYRRLEIREIIELYCKTIQHRSCSA